jgi:predicted N-acyltransferase
MPDGSEPSRIEVVSEIAQVDAAAWDACAGDADPFVSHAFLDALERSGSAVGDRGWLPQHLVARNPDGRVVGTAPLYLKSHSYGEYVFDWGWADAYERAGGRYYPKLQCAVPFTPVTGPRLLVNRALPQETQESVADTLVAGLQEVARRHDVSSLHVTFPTRGERDRLASADFLPRMGLQYHLPNPGYQSFDDFLAALQSRKRKQIRRERREVADAGLRLRRLTGSDLETRHWDAFYAFYLRTADKRWGFPYLTEEFFHELGRRLPERILLVMAEEADGTPVAGALNLIGRDALYGRNWGAIEDYDFLHFEACYYQAIEFAIQTGLSRVEAGAQGEHKIQRGYLPVATHSAHWIADPALEQAVDDFLQRERRAVDRQIAGLSEHSPYKRTEP